MSIINQKPRCLISSTTGREDAPLEISSDSETDEVEELAKAVNTQDKGLFTFRTPSPLLFGLQDESFGADPAIMSTDMPSTSTSTLGITTGPSTHTDPPAHNGTLPQNISFTAMNTDTATGADGMIAGPSTTKWWAGATAWPNFIEDSYDLRTTKDDPWGW